MPSTQAKKFKFFFYSVDATGHLNSAIGMAQALQNRGHEIVFISNAVLAPKLKPLGFRVYELNFTVDVFGASGNPAKDYAKIFKEDGHLSGRPSIYKLRMWSDRSPRSLLYKCLQQSIDFQPQIEDAIVHEKPDCFIQDHVFFQPCVAKHNIPWIEIMSVAPNFLYEHPDLAPAMSGYTEKDRPKWDEFREALNEVSESYDFCQKQLDAHFNFVSNGEYTRRVFYNVSPLLNLYQYPKELDFTELKSKVENLFSVDAFIRNETEKFEIPEQVRPNREAGERLVFLSMGSMGGFDIDLMKSLTDTLAKLPHKFIVSKGPLGSEYTLPDNMWGDDFLPQTKILPEVDLVITHGGNNSVTEAFNFGKRMIVCPLFADQFDTAQRIHDTGYGIRVEPYDHQPEELLDAVTKLLNDEQLTIRLQTAKERIESSNSKEKACKKIEQLLEEHYSKRSLNSQ